MWKLFVSIVMWVVVSIGLYAGNGLDQPHLHSMVPSASATGVSPQTAVNVVFDLPVQSRSVKKHTIVLKHDHQKIKGTTTLLEENRLHFSPAEELKEGQYRVTVKKVKLRRPNTSPVHRPRTRWQQFVYWLCSWFYHDPSQCFLCRQVCKKPQTIPTRTITYHFDVADNRPHILSIRIEPDSLELNEGNTRTLNVHAAYDNNTTQTITSQVTWTIGDPAIVSLSGDAITALHEGSTTLQAIYRGHTSDAAPISVYKQINGYRLPPEPDPKINNATLLGVDANGNGIRDDVERLIIIEEAKNPNFPKTHTAISLQYAWGWQKMIENPTIESDIYLAKASACYYYFVRKHTRGMGYLKHRAWEKSHSNLLGVRLEDALFNTKERIKRRFEFNRACSGHIFEGRDENLSDCRTNIDELGE